MSKIAGKPSVLGLANRRLVKESIRNNPLISRPQLAQRTGMSLVTVNKQVEALVQSGEILCKGEKESTGGRKAQRYLFNEDFGVTATVMVCGGAFDLELRNAAGAPIAHRVCGYDGGSRTDQLLRDMDSLLELRGKGRLLSIGIAVPGTVVEDEIGNIPQIPQWDGLALRGIVQRRYGCLTVIENDCNACAAGVYGSRGDGVRNMAFLHLGRGVGAGLILDGKLYRSGRAFAGEFGDILMGDPGVRFEDAFSACMERGDRAQIDHLIARVLACFSCILDPDAVVIESEWISAQDLEAIRRECAGSIGERYTPRLEKMCPDRSFYHEGLFLLCQEAEPDNIYIVS